MKKYTVSGFDNVGVMVPHGAFDPHYFAGENVQVSDGYHTMDELYEHRTSLFIALCRQISRMAGRLTKEYKSKFVVWRSKSHFDDTVFDGWYILGIGKEEGKQITYHLPLARWEETVFAETLERAPEWDGHSPADVLERLKNI